jgi:hypothetical protein
MDLDHVTKFLQLLVDVGLDLTWLFAHPLKFDEERSAARQPEESVRKPHPALHVQLQVLDPEFVKNLLADVRLN